MTTSFRLCSGMLGVALAVIPPVLAVVGCSDDQSGTMGLADSTVHDISVTPSLIGLDEIGDTRQFSAEARNEAEELLSGISFSWSSSDTGVATVDGDGTATARAEGQAQIVATAQGVADSATLTVDTTSSGGGSGDVAIPGASDWSAQGTVLTPAGSGAWDSRFPHGTPGPVLEKNGTYYMYYVGADGDRSSDGGPAHRAVGVATASSPSGPWSKHTGNPVIPWSAIQNNGDEEEGAWRIAGLVDDDGTILLYVSDLVGSGGSVSGDVRLFTSSDGVNFVDQGIVLDHDDSSVWGYGDELGPLGAWKGDDGTYHLFYLGKGFNAFWGLGHAWGSSPASLTATEEVSQSNTFGHGTDPIVKNDSELVMFFGDNNGDFFAYTAPRSDPGAFSFKQATYSGLSSDQFAVFLDRNTSTWYGFFTTGPQGDSDSIELYAAPAMP